MTRIAVSNLAWPDNRMQEALSALYTIGVQGVEVAPGRIAPWDCLDPNRVRDYRSIVEDAGLVVSSLQAIFYMVPDVQLLGDVELFQLMVDHLHRVGNVAAQLGTSLVVFGAPKNRKRGSLSADAASALLRVRLLALGNAAADAGITIGIEPIPESYGGEILTTAKDVIEAVAAVDHTAIRVHLDTGCVLMGGGVIGEAVHLAGHHLVHFHAAEPNLGDFAAPVSHHQEAAAALTSLGYDGWVAVEMLSQSAYQLDAMVTAARFAIATYGDQSTI